jgi:hypothetical protein
MPTGDLATPDLYWGTWGQGLLSEWWETPPQLTWPEAVITYGRMRHDPQLKGVLSAYKLPLLRATWAVDPSGCRDEVVRPVDRTSGVAPPVLVLAAGSSSPDVITGTGDYGGAGDSCRPGRGGAAGG